MQGTRCYTKHLLYISNLIKLHVRDQGKQQNIVEKYLLFTKKVASGMVSLKFTKSLLKCGYKKYQVRSAVDEKA